MHPISVAIMPTSIQLYVFHLCLEFVPHLLWSPTKDLLLFCFTLFSSFLYYNKSIVFSQNYCQPKAKYKGH